MQFLYLYLVSIPVFMAIDLLWLGVIAKSFYFEKLGSLLRTSPDWTAAVIFYLIFIFGLTFFATYPAYEAGSLVKAVLLGGLFGFMAYATYDLTNLATLKGWSLTVSLVDMAWGTFLGATVSSGAFLITRFFS